MDEALQKAVAHANHFGTPSNPVRLPNGKYLVMLPVPQVRWLPDGTYRQFDDIETANRWLDTVYLNMLVMSSAGGSNEQG